MLSFPIPSYPRGRTPRCPLSLAAAEPVGPPLALGLMCPSLRWIASRPSSYHAPRRRVMIEEATIPPSIQDGPATPPAPSPALADFSSSQAVTVTRQKLLNCDFNTNERS